MKTAESGLVQKAKQRMVNFGNAWEDCIAMALRIQAAFGSAPGELETMGFDTTWDDPETRNEAMHLQSLVTKRDLGVSKTQIFREMGYTQEQIDGMEEDAQSERVAETNIGAEILRNFQAGAI